MEYIRNTIIFYLLFLSSLNIYAQNVDSIRFTGTVNDMNMVEFLSSLQKQYLITFYYKPEWFRNETISLAFNDVPITRVIEKVIQSKAYVYEIVQGNMVVFMPREQVDLITGNMVDMTDGKGDVSMIEIGNPNEAGKYSEVKINGIVKDGKTGEALVGATIQIENTTYGVVSNLSGGFSLVLKPGFYTLIASNIGFEKASYKIKVITNGSFEIELFEQSIKIDEVSVYAQRADRNVRSNQMSVLELDAKMIKQLPSITGEKDIIKSLTMMPGVKSVGEFGSGINVRGGGEDQNLYLIEGAPIFNTSHVMGLISVINPDAVTGVTLYKGHIPAGFGERVSSVMDVKLNDINDKELHSKGGIGIYNSRLMIEGPVVKDHLSFKLGGRTSYSDFLLSKIPDYYLQNSSASFYDLNGLLKFNTHNNWITLFGYSSGDRFKYATDIEYKYGNKLVSVNWGHFFNSNLSSVVTISNSKYDVIKDELQPHYEENRTQSSVNYSSAKVSFNYSGFQKHALEGGIQGIYYKLHPGERSALYSPSLVTPQVLSSEQAYESAAYINDLYEISDHLSVSAGIRYSYYSFLGPHTQQKYRENAPVNGTTVVDTINYPSGEKIKSYQGIEPRLSFKFQINEKQSVKLSYNRNVQYISRVSYTSVSTPDDVWKLSDEYINPIVADQYAIGYYRNFFDNNLEASIEGYVKHLSNIYDYKNGARIEMNQNIETELAHASGKNYGVELLIKKNKGKLDGWISYTYSRTFIRTDGKYQEEKINGNVFYPSSYDKPHDLTVFAAYHVNRRLRISGNFMFASGRAVTLPEYSFTTGKYHMIYYSDRNKYRLPSYHRLDLSLSMDESLRIKKKWKGSWSFSILNVYGRKNAYSIFYRKENPNIQNDYNMYSLYKLYIIGRPLPTLTYNFIF